MDDLEQLQKRLESVSDSYGTFVKVICKSAKKHPSFIEPMNKYLDDHSKATTSDIIEFWLIDLLKKQY